ncbi:hypothetical protein EDB87DRAFT_1823998 [Lactarius vividus]|nr:hypothetical protein EDB87DRAFT_1823998 [Lactarius vividus]
MIWGNNIDDSIHCTGLSHKIDPDDRGSESYVAPKLLVAAFSTTTDAESPLPSFSRVPYDAHSTTITHSHSASKQPRTRTPDMYDGSGTNARALGVVLFTLATRALPFDSPLMLNPRPVDTDVERLRRRWVLRVVRVVVAGKGGRTVRSSRVMWARGTSWRGCWIVIRADGRALVHLGRNVLSQGEAK